MQIGVVELENLKADLYLSGEVQLQGFRTLVKDCALYCKVTGLVRNEADGRVRVFYDGPKDEIEKFKKQIISRADSHQIKIDPDISVYLEGHPDYHGSWKKYVGFEIDYGDTPPQEVMEAGTMHARRLISEVMGLKKDADDNYKDLALRYGNISKGIEKIDNRLKVGFYGAGKELRGLGTDMRKMGKDVTTETKKSRQVLERIDKKLAGSTITRRKK